MSDIMRTAGLFIDLSNRSFYQFLFEIGIHILAFSQMQIQEQNYYKI
jgi:hypothetical protein